MSALIHSSCGTVLEKREHADSTWVEWKRKIEFWQRKVSQLREHSAANMSVFLQVALSGQSIQEPTRILFFNPTG